MLLLEITAKKQQFRYGKLNMTNPTFTAIVLSKNEESMISACIDCLQWCNQIIVVDDGSTDETPLIAESKGAQVINFKHKSFARRREEGLKRAKTDWIIYVDSDERVTPTLAKEIMVNAETGEAAALRLRRSNIYFGQALKNGGWGDDYVTRVFKKDALSGWKGDIHESPVFSGLETTLKTSLVHLTHRDTISGLYKTASWTPMEAEALFNANISPVTFWTLMRKGGMEFIRRIVFKKGYKDGSVGLIEASIQAINRVLVYIQVWELQQKPPITEKYQIIEDEIKQLWHQKRTKK